MTHQASPGGVANLHRCARESAKAEQGGSAKVTLAAVQRLRSTECKGCVGGECKGCAVGERKGLKLASASLNFCWCIRCARSTP